MWHVPDKKLILEEAFQSMNSQLYLVPSDRSMHHCPKKSDLMKTLEAIPPKEGSHGAASQHKQNLSDMKVAIVDGMAEVQAIDKPKSIKTCKDLGHHFASSIKAKSGTYDEVHVIFDDYTVKNSLKTATRSKRLGGLASVRYKITDSTKIQHIPMKKLLSHEGTKDELTMFFSEIMHMVMKDYAYGNENRSTICCGMAATCGLFI